MKKQEEREDATKGCIKTSKGPWLVRRATKDGSLITKLRYPSARERMNNKERERNRRAVARNIFAGLRAHGDYNLPKHADSNDLLRAVCDEAGWHVEEDGTIYKKQQKSSKMPDNDVTSDFTQAHKRCQDEDEDFCTCVSGIDSKLGGSLDTNLSL